MVKRLIVVLLSLALVFGAIFGWKHRQEQQRAAQAAIPPAPAVVASTEVLSDTWQPYLRAVGSLVAVQGISVTNEVPGTVKEIRFESGQPVKEGDLLMQLDDSVDQADLKGLLADRHLAELAFKRVAQLVEKDTVSREAYDQAQAKLEIAEAQLAAKRAIIEKKQIRAPFSGALGIREIDIGEYLAPGSPIVPLQALDPIYVDYALPEQHFAELSTGQKVSLTVRAYPDRAFEGHITAINPGSDPGTRNMHIRATLKNSEHSLRPGMFAEVRTALPERQHVLTVPRTAITYNPYGDFVFVIEEKEGHLVVQHRQVKTGQVRDERVEIIEGLQFGERVVAAGQIKLRSGQQVEIDNSVKLDKPIEQP